MVFRLPGATALKVPEKKTKLTIFRKTKIVILLSQHQDTWVQFFLSFVSSPYQMTAFYSELGGNYVAWRQIQVCSYGFQSRRCYPAV